jgi:hypothetical protein
LIRRLRDTLAPVRPPGSDRGYRRILRWAAVPVTNRRWAAPLSALALGFGLFVGIAIGPGAAGTLATGAPQIVEVPGAGADNREDASDDVGVGDRVDDRGAEAGSFPTGSSEAGFSELESFGGEEAETFEAPSESPSRPPVPSEEDGEEEAEPSQPEAETVSGIVVQANPAAGSYAIVEPGGTLAAIHAAKLPAAGTQVSVPTRVLANGTLAEVGKRKTTGKRTQASFNGTVTFVDADPAAPAYTVSKRGVSVLVRVHPDPTGALPPLPVLGAYAVVEADIERPAPAVPPVAEPAPAEAAPGCAVDPAQPPPPAPVPPSALWQRRLDADGAPFTFADFAGIVAAVCPTESKLLLSADDTRAGEADIAFTVPKGIETKRLQVGESVLALATIEAGGALVLTGLASDERSKGADDAAATQGDLSSHKPK